MLNNKKAFTLIEMLVGIVLSSIIIGAIVYLYQRFNDYVYDTISYYDTLYEKSFLQEYDQLICYDNWRNKINLQYQNELCNKFNDDNDIKNYIITLSNIREKEYYKVLYIYERNNTNLYGVQLIHKPNDDLSDITINKSHNILNNEVKNYEINKFNGVVNFSIHKIRDTFNRNFIFVNKSFLR